MAVEQQYGLETQRDAILAIQGIAEVFQQPETVALLGETLGFLAESIVDVTEYIAAMVRTLDPIELRGVTEHSILCQILGNKNTHEKRLTENSEKIKNPIKFMSANAA